MSSRTWIKINCDRWFAGSIRRESPLVRSIWTDLLALAGRTGLDGTIKLPGTNIGYTDEQIASILNVQLEEWLSAKHRLAHHPDGEAEDRIRVSAGNVIEIINWSAYQSEYCRQRSYRQKLQPKVTPESYDRKCAEKEKEKEKEKENNKESLSYTDIKVVDRDSVGKRRGAHSASRKRTHVYDDDFAAFWAAYPRKVAKTVALRAWRAAIKAGATRSGVAIPRSELPAIITAAAREYAAECGAKGTPEEYVMHPSTFLRVDRWKDYAFTAT